jgi:ATP-dependent protease ClpP protease subunit
VDRAYTQNRVDEKWIEDVYLPKIKEKKKRYTRNQLKSMLTWDRSFDPKEALELGLIDEIGEIQ